MQTLWCTRHGLTRGFKIELEACVAHTCKKRKTCKDYALVSLEKVARANQQARLKGHQVTEDLPLFESLFRDNT